MVTYGDGVANIDIQNLVKYHISSGKIGTLIGVCPPSRFGELIIQNNKVLKFTEKPKLRGLRGYINGGFYVFKKEFFNFLWEEDDCVLELKPIQEIANKGELIYYKHEGFWQCMDTYRDFLYLNDLWNEDKAEWKVWT
jgi:glucose-1-phosphate cytidylyltransferase